MSFHRPNRPMGNMGFPGFPNPARPPPGMMINRAPPPMNIPPPGMGNGPGPMMQRPMPPRPNLPPNQGNKNKLVPQEISEVEDGEITKPPVTTVFVGSISERAPDNMIRTLLQRCGNIVSWKRVQGADGKLQAFGFCEFEVPEATLRCMRLLNEWPIADKKLVVKVDDKTKAMLEEYEKNHATEEAEVKREDRLALAALDAVMREFAAELRRNAPPQPTNTTPRHPREQFGVINSGPKADEGLDGVVKDEDAKNLISREINRFRLTYKDDEVVTEIKPGSRDQTSKRADSNRRRDSPDRRNRDRDRRSERDRTDKADRDKERSERERKVEREERDDRRSGRAGSRSKESSSREGRRTERSRSPRKKEEAEEDPDERYERLRLERQLRDKEQAYQERLKNWEVRERKKIREFERERQRSEERKSEEKKEARRLREFLEDYEDERDDGKYYKGHALNRRMKEREKEAEADARDRHKEREEIEELRKKLIAEGHPNPDAEITRRQNPNQVVELEDTPSPAQPAVQGVSSPSADAHNTVSHTSDNGLASDTTDSAMHTDQTSQRGKKLSAKDVFNNDDDNGDERRKRPLVPLDYEEPAKKPAKLSVADKRAAIKQLIEQIPTEKAELFAWPMDWDMVDQTLLDSRIKPWVNKKISEYIGEEEATLTEFICQKVMGKSSAQSILTDVAMVLDDEAETFVVKMWRLLVYETEAKKAGLVK